jgi:hypothetical protein
MSHGYDIWDLNRVAELGDKLIYLIIVIIGKLGKIA